MARQIPGRHAAVAARDTRRGPKGGLALASLLALVAGTAWAGWPALIPVIYAGMSLATFAAYAFDKRAAQAGGRRTPESRLHMLALFGGWPGAMAAQHWLRHKSAKPRFLAMFWATAMLNLVALALWVGQGRA
jgi:uncharacterized membrane protein YsdA (DUF1294 family)